MAKKLETTILVNLLPPAQCTNFPLLNFKLISQLLNPVLKGLQQFLQLRCINILIALTTQLKNDLSLAELSTG